MDINTLAAWGEFLGGIAVVVSLVYLASQIRQNSKLLKASTAAATTQIILSESAPQDPELSRIWWDGCADRNSLSESDQRRFDPLVAVQIQGLQQHFRFSREGIISAETWKDHEHPFLQWAQQPGIHQWWTQWGAWSFRGDFKDYFEMMMREGEAAG
jgi:hypothetical protein